MKLSTSQFRGLVEPLNIKPDKQDLGIGIQEGTHKVKLKVVKETTNMQNITKASPFFYAWRKTILRKSYLDFSKCSCHQHSYRKIRCIDLNQAQLNNSYKETSLTYSVIHTLQKQFCSGKLKVLCSEKK